MCVGVNYARHCRGNKHIKKASKPIEIVDRLKNLNLKKKKMILKILH